MGQIEGQPERPLHLLVVLFSQEALEPQHVEIHLNLHVVVDGAKHVPAVSDPTVQFEQDAIAQQQASHHGLRLSQLGRDHLITILSTAQIANPGREHVGSSTCESRDDTGGLGVGLERIGRPEN